MGLWRDPDIAAERRTRRSPITALDWQYERVVHDRREGAAPKWMLELFGRPIEEATGADYY